MGIIYQKNYYGRKFRYSENELNLLTDALFSITEISGFNLTFPATISKKDFYNFMNVNLKIVSFNCLYYELSISLKALYGNNDNHTENAVIIEFQTESWIYHEIENMYLLSSLDLLRPIHLYREEPTISNPSV